MGGTIKRPMRIVALEKRLMLDASLGALVSSIVLPENTVNATEQIIDSDVSVTGSTTDFSSDNLVISTTGGVSDQLSINNEGTGAGQIGVSGSDVTYGGTIIGSILSDGSNGSNLDIDLNANASKAAIERLIENVTYQNSSDDPTVNRTINISLGLHFSENVTVTIAPENDAPVNTVNAGVSVNEGANVTITNTDLNTTDGDHNDSDITYTLTGGPIRGQLELTTNAGVAITSFTQDDINNNRLIYVHDNSASVFDNFQYTVSDGVDTLAASTFNITVNQTNDPLTIATNNASDVSLGFSVSIGGTADDFGTQVGSFGSGTFGSIQGLIDSQDSQLRIVFTTPATIPDAVPGQVIFESGGNGRGIGLYLNSNNELAFHAGPATVAPRVLSPISLETNTQYAVVIEIDTTGDQLRMHYEQASNHDWFYEGRNSQAELSSFTETDMDGGDGAGIGTRGGGVYGGFNGTVSGVTDFQGTIDSNLIVTRPPSSNPDANDSLIATDPDTSDLNIIYTITDVTDYGTLYLDGVALGLNDTFTQVDLNKGLITYTSVSAPPGPGFTDGFGFDVSDGTTTLSSTYTLNVDTVNAAPTIYDETVIYDDDFEGGATGWNHNTTTTNATWGEFLGQFNRNIDNTNDQDLFRTFTLSGTQEYVTLEFDFLEIDTWDNERFYVFVDDVRVSNDRLRWNVYERPADDSTAGVDVRVTELTNDDGYTDVGRDVYRDQFYHYALTIPTTSSSIKIGFGTNLNSTNLNDESWGIDNVQISELRETGSGTRSVSVSEMIRNGEVATQIMAGDDDGGQTLTYSITGGTGVGVFDINSTTGEITVIDQNAIDYESGTTSYTLDVQVQDNGPGLLTDTQTITIDILDSYENTLLNLTYTTYNIPENVANGTVVGTLPFTDAEGDGVERWQIIDGNELGVFSIDATTGEVRVTDNSQINFESDNRYDIRIRAWDDNFLGLFRDQTMRINITNVDDAPSLNPEFIGENSGVPNVVYSAATGNFYRFVDSNANYATAKANAEGMMLNGVAGHLLTVESAAEKAFVNSISDQHLWLGISDAAQEGVWRYTGGPNNGVQLWQGAGANVGGSATNGFFTDWRGSHEPNNGTAYNGAVFYRNDGRWVDVPVTNNYRYMVEWEGKDVVNNDTYYLNYDNPTDLNNGDVVGRVQGLDPEGDTLTYSVTGGTGSALFSIDPTTGNVTIANAASLDPLVDYTLTVRATEDNGTNQFAETTVTIVLNENLSLDANNSHSATEGQTTTINPTTELAVSDNDGVATDIIFDIDTFPSNGQLQLSTNPGTGITTFTLDDLNNNRVQYVHDGTETSTDSFTFTVTDGGQTLPLETFNITVAPVNDAPTISVNTGATVAEGGNITVTNTMLDALDIDDAETGLTYTASNYLRGQIEVSGVVQSTFTQDDVDNNRVVFVHSGDEGGTARFDISLADGGEDSAAPATGTFNLTVTPVNDTPTITTNTGFSVIEGGSTTITTAILNTTDPDDSGAGLTYSLSNITGGQVQLSTNPGVPILSFTQADLNANRVVFVHDGGETNAQFDVSLADGGEDGAVPDTATVIATRIAVNDAPDITRNTGSSVNEGGITQIKNIVLDTTDPDNVAADLTYTITNEVNGQLELLSNLGVQITSFTQTQLDAGDIVFRHDGSSTATASFDMQVSDGALSSSVETFNLTVDNINDAPVISTGPATTVLEGQNVAITTAQLDSLDPDNLPITLTYTVTGATNGYVALASDLTTAITTFSQVDLDNGDIRFIHDGSETLSASFDVSLSDGALTDTATVNLNVTPQNDQTTLVVNDGSPNLIDFNDYTIDSFDNLQDGQFGHHTSSSVSVDGSELTINGNAWKSIDVSYTLTSNTVLSFEFRTDDIGEIFGIGFDNDANYANGVQGYQLAGTQVWGGMDQSFRNYQIGDGWVRYDIPIGADYTGAISDMVFVLDNDVSGASSASFRNVGFYESDQNLNMNEGGTFNITSAHITSVDVDDSGTGLTYTASNLRNGVVQVSGVTQATFTQDDIDNNRVTFVHDGTDTLSAGFDISLADGLENGTVTDTGTFNIIVDPVNDDTVITTNSALTLSEGSTATITTAHLNMSDSDNSPHDVIVNVTGAASNGFVARSSAPTVAITSFTLAEIQNGDIQYVHGGNEIATDSFAFTVTDGTYTSTGQTFNINLTPTNDAVSITTNSGATVAEGAGVTITNAMLDTTDTDDTATGITYTASNVANGHIEVSGVAQNTFTQDDIDNNRVVFIHDGGETTTAGFDISVIDGGEDGSGADTATFTMTATRVNDNPYDIYMSDDIVSENANIGEVVATLTTGDVDLPGDSFTYSIMADPDGKFTIIGDEILLNAALDFDVAETHTVTVRTDDGNGGTFDRLFTINVDEFIDAVVINNGGDPDFSGEAGRKLLDEDPSFDDGLDPIISEFIRGDRQGQIEAFYGEKTLGQIIRENRGDNIDVQIDANVASKPLEFFDNDIASTDGGEETAAEESRYTRLADFFKATEDHSDHFLNQDAVKSNDVDGESKDISTVEKDFDDILTYHQTRARILYEALSEE